MADLFVRGEPGINFENWEPYYILTTEDGRTQTLPLQGIVAISTKDGATTVYYQDGTQDILHCLDSVALEFENTWFNMGS